MSPAGFRFGAAAGLGTELVIRSDEVWEQIRNLHTGGTPPSWPLPEIQFARETVVVVVLGTQSTWGPSIEITGAEINGRDVTLHMLDDRRNGSGLAVTNPYHITRIPRVKGSIAFVHDHVL